MYERLRQILTRLDELKDKQALFVLAPKEQQELASLLREAQVKIKSDHPELLEGKTETILGPRDFQVYFKDGQTMQVKASDPDDVISAVPRDRRSQIDFSDPDSGQRYKWMPDTRSWAFKSTIEQLTT